ncbi:hypothetical protein CP8484711_2920A, partial [Chlamydia psittaci 84-8471/1]
MDLPLQTVYI